MPNLEDPTPEAAPSGNVIITQAQFDALKAGADGGSPSKSEFLDPKKNLVGLFFVGALVASFVIPGLGLLTFPIIIFGIMAAFGIFRDARFGGSGKRSNPIVLAFKFIGALFLAGIIAIGAFVAFIFISLSTCNCRGS